MEASSSRANTVISALQVALFTKTMLATMQEGMPPGATCSHLDDERPRELDADPEETLS